jgi:hypothetical protein
LTIIAVNMVTKAWKWTRTRCIKHLKGGPADSTALHDFHVVQLAFKNVWKHAFDRNVQALVEQVRDLFTHPLTVT